MRETLPSLSTKPVSRRHMTRLAIGLAGVMGLGAAGLSTVRAKHGADDWDDDDWGVSSGGSGGSGGLDDDWIFGSGGSGGSGDWVFGSDGSGGAGGSGGSGSDDWCDD